MEGPPLKRTMRSHWILFVLFVLLRTPKSSTAAKTEDAPLIYKQKRVQFFDHKCVTKKKSKTLWEPISNSRKAAYPLSISTSRRACNFYLWNAISASMYHLNTYLMRDAVFEGKGGRKVCGVFFCPWFTLRCLCLGADTYFLFAHLGGYRFS